MAAPYGRQTERHHDALLAIGYALGGAAGHRLAIQLGFCASADTILRVLLGRFSSDESCDHVKVLGVDDWAWRRGHRYGTVLVDLERRKPIDLLPDRESGTLARWLQDHPTVEIISRDRAGAYAEGARQGSPKPTQIADRFHLFCNLSQALHRVLERLVATLQHIQVPGSRNATPADESGRAGEPDAPVETAGNAASVNKHQAQRQQSREKRKALFDAVRAAHQRGLTKRAIASDLGVGRRTVRKFLRAEEFPERAPRRRRSRLEEYREYLEKRWAEGCHNASQLCRELRQLGYGGERSRVKEYLHAWRVGPQGTAKSQTRKLPNLKSVALWLTNEPAKRGADAQVWVNAVTPAHPHIATVEQLAQQFRQVFRDKDTEAFNAWLHQTACSGIPEMETFAAGIRRDYSAVAAAVVQPWSNGPVEGQVHRLKFLKRQMYGRSGFELLRRRVLPLRTLHIQRSP